MERHIALTAREPCSLSTRAWGCIRSMVSQQRAFPHLQIINPGVGEGGQALEACLTPDSQYVMSGNPDNSIRAWSVATGAEVARWSGHAGVPTCLKVSVQLFRLKARASRNDTWM